MRNFVIFKDMALSNRERLIRFAKGADLDNMVRYTIEYSLDIRGKVTIWGGMEYLPEEAIVGIDDPKQRVTRSVVALYEYERCSPYTARIYQMEQELDETISDETLIEEYQKFRQDHPEDGFGHRFLMLSVCHKWGAGYEDEEEDPRRWERDDKQEVRDRLLKQERQDILNLWGVDCPPDINVGENYRRRLMDNKGSVSNWFQEEFKRIGGNWRKLYPR